MTAVGLHVFSLIIFVFGIGLGVLGLPGAPLGYAHAEILRFELGAWGRRVDAWHLA